MPSSSAAPPCGRKKKASRFHTDRRRCWWTARKCPSWNCGILRSLNPRLPPKAMPLRNDLLSPISEDHPSGESLRYAPVYDKIKEARREDDDAPQGLWQRERKVADWSLTVKLISETLATKTKDLQLVAWLAEAMLKREGVAGLRATIDLARGFLENFWDTLYPELEDGDVELRVAPLQWFGDRLEISVKRTGITKSGLSWFQYKESRVIGTEESADTNDKKVKRAAEIPAGKI